MPTYCQWDQDQPSNDDQRFDLIQDSHGKPLIKHGNQTYRKSNMAISIQMPMKFGDFQAMSAYWRVQLDGCAAAGFQLQLRANREGGVPTLLIGRNDLCAALLEDFGRPC